MAVADFASKVEKMADKMLTNGYTENDIYEQATVIESWKKYKIKDYENAINELTNRELMLYKTSNGRIIDKSLVEKLELTKKLIETAKGLRKEYNRKTNKIDTNLLTASPFFVGGNRKLKQKGKERGHIALTKNGIRKMTYYNDLGVLLTYNDAKTLFALFAIWEEQGKDEWVTFTEYQLLDKMNMGFGGRQYQILRESLEKIRKTSVVLLEAYDIESGKRFVTEKFPLIIAEKFTEDIEDNGRVRSKTYSIQFSPYFVKSIKLGYYSLISLALMDELDSDSAKGIYSMICGIISMDKKEKEEYVKENGEIEIPVKNVYEHLKLDNPKPSKNRVIVEKACEELKEIDIISYYFFSGVGRRADTLVIKPSKWLLEVTTKAIENSRGELLQLDLLTKN